MRRLLCILAIAWPVVALAESRKLPVSADVGICAHPNETALNTGGNSRVRLKGNEHYYLFNFDAAPVKNWKITSATLHLKLARGRIRRLATCTVPVAWVEGTGVNKPLTDATCFLRVRPPSGERAVPWAPGGGTMLDATFNSPYMMWRSSEVTTGPDGWMKIPLDPRLVQAVAVGLSQGLVLAEEKGQTMANHDVFTREQANAQPYLTVEGQAVHVAAPSAVARPKPKVTAFPAASDFVSGGMLVEVSWAGKDVLGSRVTLQQPIGTVGRRIYERVTFADPRVVIEKMVPFDVKANGWKWSVRVESYIGPQGYSCFGGWREQSRPLAVPKVAKLPPPVTMKRVVEGAKGWRVQWHPLTAAIPATGLKPLPAGATMAAPVTPRNAAVGLQLVLFPPGGKTEAVAVYPGGIRFLGQIDPTRGDMSMPAIREFSRVWCVRKGEQWRAETLVPFIPSAALAVPWKLNGIAGQTYQSVFLDVWVDDQVPPGSYELEVIVAVGSEVVVRPKILLVVADVTLPDDYRIVASMNAYSSPARAMGVKVADAKRFIEMERKYYQLAHRHRMTLNVLPYSQSGSINWRGAPAVKGRGADCRVTDWRQWDDRYGPLLSGEAFTAKRGYSNAPGVGRAVQHMYLPFHENWPGRIAEHFKPWPPPTDYKAFLQWQADLPPIEKCFDADFAAAWTTICRQFGEHVTAKKWRDTRYQIYPNNKHYFRDRSRGWGRGISLWLLDEPMFADDFMAVAYFGALTKKADFPCDYRIDISRPTHQRQWLDGLVALNVCADKLYEQRRLIRYRKRRFNEDYWNYRMPPSFGPDNVPWAAWPVRSYCWGATGTLPWQVVGSDGDLAKADATALMYPGRKFDIAGPVPSLRMKAWREGIQTAELMRMLRLRRNWADVQLRAWVGQVCGLSGWKAGMDPTADAGMVTFKGLTAEKLAKLGRHLLAELQAK